MTGLLKVSGKANQHGGKKVKELLTLLQKIFCNTSSTAHQLSSRAERHQPYHYLSGQGMLSMTWVSNRQIEDILYFYIYG
jgi:hypothetical protein